MATVAISQVAWRAVPGRAAIPRRMRRTGGAAARACPVTKMSTICMPKVRRLQNPWGPCQARRSASGEVEVSPAASANTTNVEHDGQDERIRHDRARYPRQGPAEAVHGGRWHRSLPETMRSFSIAL